jgi:pilus assembly protein Flp/PilA
MKMTKFFRDFMRDESGAAAAEYALILAIVGAGIAGAAFYLGDAISTSITGTANELTNCTNGSGPTTGC